MPTIRSSASVVVLEALGQASAIQLMAQEEVAEHTVLLSMFLSWREELLESQLV